MFFKDLGIGFKSYFKAIGFIFRNGMWWYYFIPLAVSILFSVSSFFAIEWAVDWVRVWSEKALGLEPDPNVEPKSLGEWIESGKAFINGARDIMLMVLLKVVFWYLFLKLNKYIVLIVLSPVMAWLSEKTEEILTNSEYPFDIIQFTREVWRGVLIATRNIIIEFGFILGCWVLSFFLPVIAPFVPFFLFFVGAYYYGFSMMDYVNERRRFNIGQSVRYIRQNKGVATGLGSVFALVMYIPFFGFIFAPITSSVAAVLAIHEKGELKSEYSRPKEIE